MALTRWFVGVGFIGALALSACGSSAPMGSDAGHGGGGHAGASVGGAGASAGAGGGTGADGGGGAAGTTADRDASADRSNDDRPGTNLDGGSADVPADGGGGADGGASFPAGSPLPLCGSFIDCAAGSSCVPYMGFAVLATPACDTGLSSPFGVAGYTSAGHCIPDGEAGGICRAAGTACDSGLACDPFRYVFSGGACPPGANAVTSPINRCAPAVAAGAACGYDVACADSVCIGASVSSITPAGACVGPGGLKGACRTTAPRCDTGLGCTARVGGTCLPLATMYCQSNGSFIGGCADGFNCSQVDTSCVADGTEGGVCRSTAPACDTGFACKDTGYCRSPSTFTPPSCSGVGQCPAGSSCVDGRCHADGIENGICLPDGTCQSGSFVVTCATGNVCKTNVNADGASCASGTCKVGSECTSQAHICTAYGGVGTACGSARNAHPCSAGLFCSNLNTCADPAQALADGTICGPSDVCAPGATCVIPDVSGSPGACRKTGAAGGLCRTRGLKCDAGLDCWASAGPLGVTTCQPATLPGGAACDPKSTTVHCLRGSSCINNVCVDPGTLGGACRAHDPNGTCDPPLACINGSCAPGIAEGASCSNGETGPDFCALPNICQATNARPCPASGCLFCGAAGYVEEVVATLPFIDACAAGTHLPLRSSGSFDARFAGHAQVSIYSPFPIDFWNASSNGAAQQNAFEALTPSTKGFVSFVGIRGDFGVGNGYLPTDWFGAVAAPFWDDLLLGDPPTSDICYVVTGQTPARKLVIEWAHAQRYGVRGSDLDFEVVFNETTRVIEFAYRTLAPGTGADAAWADGSRASIGLQSGYNNVAIRHEGAVVAGGGLRYTPR